MRDSNINPKRLDPIAPVKLTFFSTTDESGVFQQRCRACGELHNSPHVNCSNLPGAAGARDAASRRSGTTERETLNVKITAPWIAAEMLSIALDIYSSSQTQSGILLYCIPGGGVNRGYFNMKPSIAGAKSFATEMAGRGHTVIVIDPPGVGDSTRPADGFKLSADAVADCLHLVLLALLEAKPELKLLSLVGTGHSAGSMLVAIQQARWRDFKALLLTCFTTGGLPGQFNDAELAALAAPDLGRSRLPELTQQHFGAEAYLTIKFSPSSPDREPLRNVLDNALALVAMQAMTPGNIAPELAQIDVPVMLALGDRDITGDPHQAPSAFKACGDLYLHVVAESGHHIFLAAAAPKFYDRAGEWLSSFAGERHERAI